MSKREWRREEAAFDGHRTWTGQVSDADVLREAARIVRALPMETVWCAVQWGDAQRAVLWGKAIESLDTLATRLEREARGALTSEKLLRGLERYAERPTSLATPEFVAKMRDEARRCTCSFKGSTPRHWKTWPKKWHAKGCPARDEADR